MRQVYSSLSVFLLIFGAAVGTATAQKDTTKLNQSVEVMKAYHPSIQNASKLNLMPVLDDTTHFTPEFKYSINSRPVNAGFAASPIEAADVSRLPKKDLGLGYLKLGAGTLSTLYGELFVNLPKSGIGTAGLHFKHLSSDAKTKLSEGDIVDAPYSKNNAGLFGTLNIGNTILSADLSYNRDAMRYYGYPVAISENMPDQFGLKQAYQSGDLKIVLKSDEKNESDFMFNGGFNIGYFDAKTGQKQSSGGFFGKFGYNLGQVKGILGLSFDNLSTDGVHLGSGSVPGTRNETWLRVAPSVRLDGNNLTLRGGVRFVTVSSKGGEKMSRLYPDFELNFKPIEEMLTIYAGFNGDLKNNRYSDIAYENYWTDPHHNALNTDYTYIISGGLKGKISGEISYNLGLKYSQAKDLYFYVMNSYDIISSGTVPPPLIYNNAFDLTYDNAGITNFSAEFSYISGKDLSVVVKGNYYNYSLQSLAFAPEKPTFDLSLLTGFRIIERLTGFADADIVGQRKALIYHTSPLSSVLPSEQVLFIDPSIRLNLGATYDITTNFKLFGRVDNLLNRQNEQWLGYPSQGLRLMAGITLSF